MKLTKEDIEKYGTEEEQKQLTEAKKKSKPKIKKKAPRRPTNQNKVFLVFESTMYVESFEESFLGAYTDGEAAYKASKDWYRHENVPCSIYQVMTNTDLGKNIFDDVTQDLEDLYEEFDD